MTGGGRGKGKKYGRMSQPNKPPPRACAAVNRLVDLMSPLIKTIPFDHFDGDYGALIPDLREIFTTYDPNESTSLISEYFGVVFQKKDAPNDRKCTAFLQKFDAYFLAFFNKKLYEFGVGDEARKFYESTVLGYKENYTDTLLDKMTVGYYALRDGIEAMMNEAQGNEDPKPEVLFGWRPHLVLIMAMLSEASRYHPVFEVTNDLWKRRTDTRLPKGLAVYMQNWSKASDILSGEDTRDNGELPPDVFDYHDRTQAARMVESRLGAKKALAFPHPGKINGAGTSRDCRFLEGGAIFKLIAPPKCCLFLWFSSWWTRYMALWLL